MKAPLYIFTAFGLALIINRACASESEIIERIQHEVAGPGWQITADLSSVTLIHTNVQFLNPINPPTGIGIDEEQTWKELSSTNNYRITILFESKLSQVEYDQVSALRDELIANRTKGLNRQTMDYFSASEEAKSLVHLPDYYIERNSVYVYCSDLGFFEIRPAEVVKAHEKIMQILDQTCSKYIVEKPVNTASPGNNPSRP